MTGLVTRLDVMSIDLDEIWGIGRFFAQNNSEKKTVRAKRRRRGSDDRSSRERADAPRRRKSSGSSGGSKPPRPVSGGSSSSGGPLLPGGGKIPPVAMIVIVIILLLLGVPLSSIIGGDSGGGGVTFEETGSTESDSLSNFDPATATPFTAPVSDGEGQTWLVMLYQDADDKILEQDIYLDLNEAERVGSSDNVHIVSQVDRFTAGYAGDGNWSTTRRYYVTRDDDLNAVNSVQMADLGETNMADGQTLVDFVTWAVESYPADKYVLIMSDHGIGWPGGWSDPDPAGRISSNIPIVSALGDELYLMELDAALTDIRDATGIDQFELIGMDACLMGHVEVFSALAPHARYAVASQEVEPALGWAYTGFLGELKANPNMTGADLGRFIVESYIDEDQRIVDDQARAAFARQGSGLSGLFGLLTGGGGAPSASQLAAQMERNITLTTADLSAFPQLIDSLNNLSYALQGANQASVARARNHAQSFTSVFGNNVPPSYIDLGNFAQLLQRETNDPAVDQAVDELLTALDEAIVAERHGRNVPGATGLSVYFPNSQLYANPITGPESYTAVAERFALASLWDDFLTYHYTGATFEADSALAVIPQRSSPVIAPGAGQIELSPLSLSSDTVSIGESVLMSSDVSGTNMGYAFLFVGFLDEASNSVFLADADYLESVDTREVGGVFYPDWGAEEFTLEFEWEPLVFAIDDGVSQVVARFKPESYGETFEDAVYSVDGLYTYADGGESRYARLFFRDGVLRQVYGFTGNSDVGAPREIIPRPGDTFTVYEQWLDLDANGRVIDVATQEGGTLTFSEQNFVWVDLNAAPGRYTVGFIIEDLDGNRFEVYSPITVE